MLGSRGPRRGAGRLSGGSSGGGAAAAAAAGGGSALGSSGKRRRKERVRSSRGGHGNMLSTTSNLAPTPAAPGAAGPAPQDASTPRPAASAHLGGGRSPAATNQRGTNSTSGLQSPGHGPSVSRSPRRPPPSPPTGFGLAAAAGGLGPISALSSAVAAATSSSSQPVERTLGDVEASKPVFTQLTCSCLNIRLWVASLSATAAPSSRVPRERADGATFELRHARTADLHKFEATYLELVSSKLICCGRWRLFRCQTCQLDCFATPVSQEHADGDMPILVNPQLIETSNRAARRANSSEDDDNVDSASEHFKIILRSPSIAHISQDDDNLDALIRSLPIGDGFAAIADGAKEEANLAMRKRINDAIRAENARYKDECKQIDHELGVLCQWRQHMDAGFLPISEEAPDALLSRIVATKDLVDSSEDGASVPRTPEGLVGVVASLGGRSSSGRSLGLSDGSLHSMTMPSPSFGAAVDASGGSLLATPQSDAYPSPHLGSMVAAGGLGGGGGAAPSAVVSASSGLDDPAMANVFRLEEETNPVGESAEDFFGTSRPSSLGLLADPALLYASGSPAAASGSAVGTAAAAGVSSASLLMGSVAASVGISATTELRRGRTGSITATLRSIKSDDLFTVDEETEVQEPTATAPSSRGHASEIAVPGGRPSQGGTPVFARSLPMAIPMRRSGDVARSIRPQERVRKAREAERSRPLPPGPGRAARSAAARAAVMAAEAAIVPPHTLTGDDDVVLRRRADQGNYDAGSVRSLRTSRV